MSEDKKTIVKMAHIYSQEGRWDKAIAEYKKLIKLDPEDYNSYSMIGDVYVKKGETQPAFDAYLVCSEAYIRLGQLEKAALVQSKIARLNPAELNEASRKKQAIFQKQVEADRAFEAGELDAAVEAYQAVLDLDPDRFDLYQKLGDLYLRKGDTANACKKYLEIGNIYYRNKLIKKAAPIFLKVVELDPENVEAYAALAEIHAKSGNESEAKREILQVAEMLFLRGDYERCYQFARKGEQLKSIDSYNYLGHVELQRGNVEEARAWFEKLLKFKLNHGGALWGMARVHLKNGNVAEAEKALAKVPKHDRFYAEARAEWAALLEKQGKLSEAAEAYLEASKLLRAKGLEEAAKAAAESAGRLGAGVSGETTPAAGPAAPANPSPAPVQELPAVSVSEAESAPAPGATLASAGPPPLPPVPAQTLSPLPPLTPLPSSAASTPLDTEAGHAGDDNDALMGLADNFEMEGAFDEAIALYQRILVQDPNHADAKAALGRIYGKLARGAMGGNEPAADLEAAAEQAEAKERQAAEEAARAEALARLAAEKARQEAEQKKAEEDARRQAEELARVEAEAKRLAEERAKAEAEAKRLADEKYAVEKAAREKAELEARLRAEAEAKLKAEIEARQKAEQEAKRAAEEAAKQAEAMKARLEAEIRAQLEAEMRKRLEEDLRRKADEEIALKVLEAKRQAEAEARKAAEEEIRRRFEAERAKLQNEKEEVKRQLEAEMRARISADVERRSMEQAAQRVENVRKQSEDEARKKIQADVLARVQAQQREKLAPLQRTIEEIRRKVEEQQAAARAAETARSAAVTPAKPASVSAAAKDDGADDDDMDDFMTAAVADIYVKQGLVKEAVRIYERILKREPGNVDVRAKLDALQGGAKPKPEGGGDAPKKSKVSYL